VYRQAPPIPARVVSEDGTVLATRDQILDGQQVWQSIGGQQIGSIWGDGAYQAPDWSADWLHREATGLLELWSTRDHGVAYAEAPADARAVLEARLRRELRTNRFDATDGTLTVWNLVGAGVFGFLINPPIALYYMQGLNTTPVHGHTALFGVYGLLALALVLIVLRRLRPAGAWAEGALAYAFWAMNGGLALMVGLSLLPIGLLQAHASATEGLWYARSADFLQLPLLESLRWMRVAGDVVFLSGVAALAWFVIGLWTGHSYVRDSETEVVPVPAASRA
jgi:nitric oxide reductase subunit B